MGVEMVDYLIRYGVAESREAAVRIGNLLIVKQQMHHIVDMLAFQDSNDLYRFYCDEALGDGSGGGGERSRRGGRSAYTTSSTTPLTRRAAHPVRGGGEVVDVDGAQTVAAAVSQREQRRLGDTRAAGEGQRAQATAADRNRVHGDVVDRQAVREVE